MSYDDFKNILRDVKQRKPVAIIFLCLLVVFYFATSYMNSCIAEKTKIESEPLSKQEPISAPMSQAEPVVDGATLLVTSPRFRNIGGDGIVLGPDDKAVVTEPDFDGIGGSGIRRESA